MFSRYWPRFHDIGLDKHLHPIKRFVAFFFNDTHLRDEVGPRLAAQELLRRGTQAGEVDPLAVIARVDAALYRAKRAGRNRVAVADETTAST